MNILEKISSSGKIRNESTDNLKAEYETLKGEADTLQEETLKQYSEEMSAWRKYEALTKSAGWTPWDPSQGDPAVVEEVERLFALLMDFNTKSQHRDGRLAGIYGRLHEIGFELHVRGRVDAQ